VTKTVEQIRAQVDAQLARERAKRERAKDSHRYRRIREMPELLAAAKKRLDMLQAEAQSYGLDTHTGLRIENGKAA